jgi:flagellar hook protein FlgE
MRVYDSLGASHDVTLTFTRSATDGVWDVTGTSADGAVSVGPPAQILFDDQGRPLAPSLPLQITLSNPNGAAATIDIALSVADVTQLAQESSAALFTQDGVPPGTLTGLSVNGDGSIAGVYSNGLTSTLGQLVTAVFSNTGGLQSERNSLFSTTVNSGEPTYGAPGNGNRGAIRSGQLETSNVNLAQEFADMIVTQRGFQASARVVTTADEMLQELMNVAS